jgi:hypothetical protein
MNVNIWRAAVRRRPLVCGIGVCLAVMSVSEGTSQEARGAPHLRIELNRLEPVPAETCRAYLLIENSAAAAYRSLKLDLFAFDIDGVIAKRVALEAGPVLASKTSVKLFDFAGVACDRLGRVLLNDVIGCETAKDAEPGCLAAIATSSRVGRVGFVK